VKKGCSHNTFKFNLRGIDFKILSDLKIIKIAKSVQNIQKAKVYTSSFVALYKL
jgi:hypothetical protein